MSTVVQSSEAGNVSSPPTEDGSGVGVLLGIAALRFFIQTLSDAAVWAGIHKPVFEVRALGTQRGTMSGYFDTFDSLAMCAQAIDGKADGVYITLNPVKGDLLARAKNRIQVYAKHTTSDADILRRLWLLVDLDARRPAGISATDAEHGLALTRARDVEEWLAAQGWPEPIAADSGNGAHLLYAIDLPNDEQSKALVERVLAALDARFSDDAVAVDTKVFNAARISKLYGTLVCKGDSTADRPHRRASVLRAPSQLAVVPREMLDVLAGQAPATAAVSNRKSAHSPARGSVAHGTGSLDMARWLADHGLVAAECKDWKGGKLWVLDVCPFDPAHTNRSAYVVQHPSGAVAAGCHHQSCQGKGWRDLRDLVEPEWSTSGVAVEVDEWERPVPLYEMKLPPFPVDALPARLARFVAREATATQTPPDLAAMLVLSVIALACAKKARIEPKPGYVEPLNLYTLSVLPPGDRKSAVFRDVVAPVAEFEAEEVEAAREKIAAAKAEKKRIEAILKQSEAAQGKATTEEERSAAAENVLGAMLALEALDVPRQPRFLADDVTVEKLATLMCDHDGRMGVMSPEGELFEVISGRYSNTNSPNLGVVLKGHSGDQLRVDRVNRPSEFVDAPALTIGLAVQPDVISCLMAKTTFKGRGLLGRFLYSLPRSLLGSRSVRPDAVPEPVRAAYHEDIRALMSIPFQRDERGAITEPRLHLDDEAQERYFEFAETVEAMLGSGGDLAAMTDWGGKYVGEVMRIAGLLHLADHAGDAAAINVPIGAAVIARAIEIGEYLRAHATAAYLEMGADPAVEGARHLLAWLGRTETDTFSLRDAFEGCKGRLKKTEHVAAALNVLVEHGFVRMRPPPEHGGPGRKPSPTFEVNPHWALRYAATSQTAVPGPADPSLLANSANSATSTVADAPAAAAAGASAGAAADLDDAIVRRLMEQLVAEAATGGDDVCSEDDWLDDCAEAEAEQEGSCVQPSTIG